MRRVNPEVKEAVLEEFYELCLAQNYLAIGGIDYAKEMLEKALGPAKASGIIDKLISSLQIRPLILPGKLSRHSFSTSSRTSIRRPSR